MSNDLKDSSSLSELFDNAFHLFNEINKSEEPTNSPKVQSDIRKTMNLLEDLTRLVSVLDMFSENETIEEMATEHVKYLLLPALLGTLTTKICGTDDRLHIVEVAEIYFLDFLKRLKAYGLIDMELPEMKKTEGSEDDPSGARPKSNAEMVTEMVTRRNTKLQRYKEQKELQSQLETMEKHMDNPNIDDEIKRKYFITLLKLYVNQTIEELSSLAAEKPILEHMQRMGHTETMTSRTSKPSKSIKLQPIIITRDEVQKKVYGAGYPSLPIMTVQEFYEQRIRDGEWPDPSKFAKMNTKCLQDMVNTDANSSQQEAEDIEKEEKIENDDEQYLKQARAMDEYKDTHKRGWGNRANRS